MRKFNLILANAAIAATLLLSSCGNDDEDETKAEEVAGPSITLQQNTTSTATIGDVDVDVDSPLNFQLSISKGDKNVEFLKIEKTVSPATTADVIATASVVEEGKTNAVDYDQTEASYKLPNSGGVFLFTLTASSVEGSVTTYTFTAKDKDGLTSSKSVKVTTNKLLTSSTGKMVYNNAGSGHGSFDFDALTDVSSVNDTEGDIKDNGGATDWSKTFDVKNGATMVGITSSEYTSANTLADIEALYANNTQLTTSAVYAEGNSYVLKTSAGKYVAFSITDVSDVDGKDDDTVTFSVKSVVVSKGDAASTPSKS